MTTRRSMRTARIAERKDRFLSQHGISDQQHPPAPAHPVVERDVLDAAHGTPAEGMELRLERLDGSVAGELAGERGEDGLQRYVGDVPLERAGSFGYTVRVLPRNAALSTAAELGLVVSA